LIVAAVSARPEYNLAMVYVGDKRALVSRSSLAEQVANALRNMILTGELRPGARNTQEELAERLQVSTMPVREALLRLTYEGFVDTQPNRSFRVAPMSRQDLYDIYWMNSVVIGELTARATERADSRLIDQLRENHAQRLGLGVEGIGPEIEMLNTEFHRLINHAAASPKLSLVLRNMLRFVPEHFFELAPSWYASSICSHEEILEAIGRGDASAAREAAERHVREAGAMLADFFNDQGFWTVPD
jgi:DNA-binding GntR family transcriptional regulator